MGTGENVLGVMNFFGSNNLYGFMDSDKFKSAVGASFLDDSLRDKLRRDPEHIRRMEALTLLDKDKKAAYSKYPDLKDYFDEKIELSKEALVISARYD